MQKFECESRAFCFYESGAKKMSLLRSIIMERCSISGILFREKSRFFKRKGEDIQ